MNLYVRSGGNLSAPWNAVYATLDAAAAAATAADTIFIAHDHAETTASAITTTFPSTSGLRPLRLIRSTPTPQLLRSTH